MPPDQLSVLIIDDTPEDRETVRRYLTRGCKSSYSVIEAETGEEGLAVWREARPDVVLLDFHLPDMSGLEFLDELFGEAGTEVLPVVMLTGTGNETLAVQAMKSGAQDYLVKGYATPDRLERAIYYAIDKVDMLRRLEEQHGELEQKNRELEAADRRKDEFLAVLAHELRNPLAAIRNAVELLKRAGDDPSHFRQAVQILERQVRHQGHLLDDLLDVSRITRGKILLRCKPVDLARLLRDTVQDHSRALEQAQVRAELEVPEQPVWIEADAVRLSQVFGNLLTNAAKFTDPGGSVRVSLSVDTSAGTAAVRFTDDGIGISGEMLEHLFVPFAQADRSLDRSLGGLGLGLALVKGLVELHSGTVEARSEGIGKGAEFQVTLPLDAVPDGPSGDGATLMDDTLSRPAAEAPRRVLIVEDNRDAADTLQDLLEMSGHTVEVAYTGPSGVDIARTWIPDVVLCDLGLPGIDGYQVAQQLRSDPATAGIRLIAISGYGQEEDRQRSRSSGFDMHLTKPVDPGALERLLFSEKPE